MSFRSDGESVLEDVGLRNPGHKQHSRLVPFSLAFPTYLFPPNTWNWDRLETWASSWHLMFSLLLILHHPTVFMDNGMADKSCSGINVNGAAVKVDAGWFWMTVLSDDWRDGLDVSPNYKKAVDEWMVWERAPVYLHRWRIHRVSVLRPPKLPCLVLSKRSTRILIH